MSYQNPTRVRIGMHGQFDGRDYRVVGRSVMGESEDGETYYWNEFTLNTDSGEEATLVYEETADGARWRFFTLFEPEFPITVSDAAAKQVGDSLNLTGETVRINFRGRSRVYYVEGKAPEGEEVGTSAEYFNAAAGAIMQVVSWTGDEVECYHGATLSRGAVAAAFGLPIEAESATRRIFSGLTGSGSSSGNYWPALKPLLAVGMVLLFFLLISGRSCSTNPESAPVTKRAAPARPLDLGATGTIFNKHYRVTARAVVEVAEVGADWSRHEYELTDDLGAKSLLVCGDKPGGDWILFEPFYPMISLTAKQAAAKQLGDLLELDGYTGKVTEIFLSTIESTEGAGLDGLDRGTRTYGLGSKNDYVTLLARWNEAGIQYFRGRSLPASKGAAGFTAGK
jgi:hypothetical protein